MIDYELTPENKIALSNLQIFSDAKTFWEETVRQKTVDEYYYQNKQFTKNEQIANQQRTNSKPIIVNICKTNVDQETAILTSDKPIFKASPINGKDKYISYLADQLLVGTANANNYNLMHETDVKNMLKTGVSWNRIRPARDETEGFLNIVIETLDFKKVYPSRRWTKQDLSDFNDCIIADYVPLDELCSILNCSVEDIMGNPDNSSDSYQSFAQYNDLINMPVEATSEDIFRTNKTSNPMVLYLERYQRVVEERYKLETLDYAARIAFKLPQWLTYEELAELYRNPEILQLIEKGIIIVSKVKIKNVYRYDSAGYFGKRKNLNVEYIPVVPITNEWNGSYETTYSEIHYLRPLQDGMNKFIVLTLANIMFTLGKLIYDKDEVTESQVKQFVNGEINALGYSRQSLNKTGNPIEMMYSRPMDNGSFTLYQDLFSKSEYTTGMYSMLMGNSANAPDVFSTVAAMESFGTQRIKNKARYISTIRAIEGKIVLQFISRYASAMDVVRFVSETGEKSDIPINVPEFSSAGEIIDVLNDISAFEYDVVLTTQPNLGTTRAAQANILNTLMTQQKIPPTQSTMRVMADKLDMPALDQIGAELDQVSQLSQANEQMQKEFEKLNKINEQLEKQLMQQKKAVELKNFEVELDKLLTKFASDMKVEKSVLKNNIEIVMKELDMIAERAEMEGKLQNEKMKNK